MSETKTYVFPNDGNASVGSMMGYLAPLLQRQGVDPNVLALLNNGNGNRGGWNDGEGFLWLLFLLIFANGGWGNGFGGFGGGLGGNALGTGYLSNQLNNDLGRDLLMQAINGNGDAIRQLATQLNCSVGDIQQTLNVISGKICEVGNQVGMSAMQIVNAVQSGNASIASQIANCCCDIKGAIADSKYATERGFSNTNQILSQGFSSVAYETQRQTCDIEKAIANSTSQILEGQRAAEMRELQDKLDAAREKSAQQAVMLNNAQQTSQFAAMLAPIQADLAELKCNQPPIKKIACPEQYVPINNGINATYGLIPTGYCGCGYGFPYGNFVNGFNNAF